jgi:hypothetical protein
MSALQPAPLTEPSRTRVREGLSKALQQRSLAYGPRPSWRRSVTLLVALSIGLAVVIAIAGVVAGVFAPSLLLTRLASLTLLTGAGVFAAVTAVRPGTTWTQRWASVLGILVAVVAVLAVRGVSIESVTPAWACTAGHFGAELIPGVAAIFVLRAFDPGRLRGALVGGAVGITGLFLGELACQRDMMHVLLFHLPVMVAMVVVVPWLATRLGRRSFAP